MKACRRVFLVVCLLIAGPASSDEIYRWTDADGRVHYGSRPPPGVAAETKSISPRPPVDDPALNERRERQRRLLESYDYERSREAELTERQRRQDQQRAVRCQEIERHLRQLDYPGPVYVTDPDGTRRYLDDTERERQKVALQPAYRRDCGPED